MIPDASATARTPAPEAVQPHAGAGCAMAPDDGPEVAAPARAGSPAAIAARARDAAIAASILRLVAERGPGRSICPSEAAREVAAAEGRAEWHTLMGNVRRIAGRLLAEGRVEILRKGRPAAADARGVIRLRQPGAAPAGPAGIAAAQDGPGGALPPQAVQPQDGAQPQHGAQDGARPGDAGP